jgi:sporulation protein YunB
MVSFREGRRRRSRFVFITFVVMALLIAYLAAFVNPVVVRYSTAKIEAMTVKAVNRCVNTVVGANTYRNLVDIRYDDAGKITSLTTNMLAMNGLSSDISLGTQQQLDMLASYGIEVPIGTFSGLPILTGQGPAVKLRVVPVGSINCSFSSDFAAAGINQTRHRIILKVRALVNLVMPLFSRTVDQTIEVMLCESIIIGEVPEWMWGK